MVRSVLAALLFGVLPAPSAPLQEPEVSVAQVDIAPLADPITITERLSASGVIITNVLGGQELYAKQSDIKRPMASLTKLMTALVILEHHDLDEWVRIPRDAEETEGNRAYLPSGERFTVDALLSALLISSANDAAVALALHNTDSVTDFVALMNERAQSLGLVNTHFANPMGLDSTQQWSTPRDISRLLAFALRSDVLREKLSRRGQRIYSYGGQRIDLTHTHALLHANTIVTAGKTGTTDAAKECLSSLVQFEDQEYLVVLMHSDNRYRDMRKILAIFQDEETDVLTYSDDTQESHN